MGGNRTAYETCLSFQQRHKKRRLAKEGVVANIAERQQQKLNKSGTKKSNVDARAVQQTQIKTKYSKNTTLIRGLSKPV